MIFFFAHFLWLFNCECSIFVILFLSDAFSFNRPVGRLVTLSPSTIQTDGLLFVVLLVRPLLRSFAPCFPNGLTAIISLTQSQRLKSLTLKMRELWLKKKKRKKTQTISMQEDKEEQLMRVQMPEIESNRIELKHNQFTNAFGLFSTLCNA